MQNVLNYVALTYLDPATFQITQQLKILATALFSVILLGTKISVQKWTALFLILAGVVAVHVQQVGESADQPNQLLGFIAVIVASCSSGFAGVWFEMALKSRKSSVFVRNIQLSVFSVVPGVVFILLVDLDAIIIDGCFRGFNTYTVLSIILMACGGIVVALLVKYADSIVKVIATTLSFVLSSFLSVYLFDFHISKLFLVGSGVVLVGTHWYLLGVPKVATVDSLPRTNPQK